MFLSCYSLPATLKFRNACSFLSKYGFLLTPTQFFYCGDGSGSVFTGLIVRQMSQEDEYTHGGPTLHWTPLSWSWLLWPF